MSFNTKALLVTMLLNLVTPLIASAEMVDGKILFPVKRIPAFMPTKLIVDSSSDLVPGNFLECTEGDKTSAKANLGKYQCQGGKLFSCEGDWEYLMTCDNHGDWVVDGFQCDFGLKDLGTSSLCKKPLSSGSSETLSAD